jgi:hypothetical protein
MATKRKVRKENSVRKRGGQEEIKDGKRKEKQVTCQRVQRVTSPETHEDGILHVNMNLATRLLLLLLKGS